MPRPGEEIELQNTNGYFRPFLCTVVTLIRFLSNIRSSIQNLKKSKKKTYKKLNYIKEITLFNKSKNSNNPGNVTFLLDCFIFFIMHPAQLSKARLGGAHFIFRHIQICTRLLQGSCLRLLCVLHT